MTDPNRQRTLTAALARLVPPGAGPGAVEAGAVDYVAARLDDFLTGGIDRLDQLAGGSFADLEPPRQDAILAGLEKSSPLGARFLRQLVLLALEGSFCHPARGGNLDGEGWRFAGLGADPAQCR